jgi:DNA replication protein DnaC
MMERRRRRVVRSLRKSDLPREKTLATLKRSKLPAKVANMLPTLCEGSFVQRGDNVIAFGLPGRGKRHFVCALGH